MYFDLPFYEYVSLEWYCCPIQPLKGLQIPLQIISSQL